ncbi:MAG: hypothetical protein IH899_06675 [Planctomycetes bacterium]|nr:hypothetical protein [Planctomycetota bacterium]
MSRIEIGEVSWERMIRAVEKVRERLMRAVSALEKAGIPYAVIGGHAVAAWVSRVDEAAVRNTRDVNILIRRSDLDAVTTALESAGFVYRHSAGIDMFLDGPDAKARDAVHLLFAGEKVRPQDTLAAPDVTDSEQSGHFQLLTLDALLKMKLTSYRRKDQVHILDMLDIGLLDDSWCQRLPRELAERLQELIDNPDG